MLANLRKPLQHLNQSRRKIRPSSKLAFLLNVKANWQEAEADAVKYTGPPSQLLGRLLMRLSIQ